MSKNIETDLTVDGNVLVTDEAYGISWNTSLEVPTKNAVYDKIETLGGGGTIGGTIGTDQIGYGSATDTLAGSSNFTWNDSLLDITYTVAAASGIGIVISNEDDGWAGVAFDSDFSGTVGSIGVQASGASTLVVSASLAPDVTKGLSIAAASTTVGNQFVAGAGAYLKHTAAAYAELAGHGQIYNTSGGNLYYKNYLGFAVQIGGTLLPTKGDLLAYSFSGDTQLAVGTNGQVLTADSAEATGLKWADAGAGSTPTLSKSISIADPVATDDGIVFYTPVAITITKVAAMIDGTTSVSWGLRHGTSASVTTNDVFTANKTTSANAGTIYTTTFDDNTLVAGSWLKLRISTVSGTPTYFHMTIIYTED